MSQSIKNQLFIISFLVFILHSVSFGQCLTSGLPAGSYLIKTGTTYNTGLKPYGLVYDLITNYQVPVYWCINPSKQKDSADFVHNGVAYSGGTFAVNKNYITPQVASVISSWQTNQGVQGNFTISSFYPPVYDTIACFPKVMIDNSSGNTGIIINYFTNAGIPNSGYGIGAPSNLNGCLDIWANPHDDPTWASHSYLRNFVTINKGSIWAQCHLVSVLEGVRNPLNTSQGLNFLSTSGLQCYSSGKCGASITTSHSSSWSNPTTYHFPASPIMQFIGKFDNAANAGSERWFIPQASWNPETIRGVTTSNGTSPGEGAILVFGPAYGNSANGMVMYQGGHDYSGNNNTAERVAAQRAFFNYILYNGLGRSLACTNTIPSAVYSNSVNTFTAGVTNGIGPYTYQWSAPLGTFSAPTSSTTNYTAPIVAQDTTIEVRLRVSDACGRVNQVLYCLLLRRTQLPVDLLSFDAQPKGAIVKTDWITASEKNNDYFTVERSRDALQFEPIANIDGAGNSTILRFYSFDDTKPPAGLSYYRLKQTDYDGTVAYSRVVPVKFRNAQITVFPNPASGTFFIDFSAMEDATFDLKLIDMSGRVVMENRLSLEAGSERLAEIRTDRLAKGLYSVVCSTPDNVWRQHIVLQ